MKHSLINNIVQLKSGGPPMLVAFLHNVITREYICLWWIKDEVQQEIFSEPMLTIMFASTTRRQADCYLHNKAFW